jgi:hypothetical protein
MKKKVKKSFMRRMGAVTVVVLGIIVVETLDLSEFMGGFDFE